MIDPATGCPSDYASLFENYMPMIRSIVAKCGIEAKDVEDVSMELLVKFMEKDALSWYDPTKLFDVGLNPRLPGPRFRPAKFQGLLRGFCRAWVRQHLDKQALRSRREAKHLDEPVGDGEQNWGEMYALRWGPDSAAEIESVEVYESLRAARSLCRERVEGALREWTVRQAEIGVNASSRQKMAARSEAQRKIDDALHRERALVVAAALATEGVRVTGSSVARICGWPPAVGVAALRGAREDLKATGLAV